MKNLALFLLFGLVATLCDLVWVRVGALTYLHPEPWGQAWWTPLLFGVMGVVAVNASAILTRLLSKEIPTTTEAPVLDAFVAAALFVASYLACGLFDRTPEWIAAVLAAAWVLRMVIEALVGCRPALSLIICIALCVAGVAGEALLVAAGQMSYAHPSFMGLPLWLPALWLHAGFLVRHVARAWFYGR
jgi:hypothetical protein